MSIPTIDVHEVLRLGAGVDVAGAWDALLGLLESVETCHTHGILTPDAVLIMAVAARMEINLLALEGEALKAARAQLAAFKAGR
jgi:hypothetical protein